MKIKNIINSAIVVLMAFALTNCGDSSNQKKPQPSPPQSPTDQEGFNGDSKGQSDQSDDTTFACSYSINGKSYRGNSKKECDQLKKQFESAQNDPSTADEQDETEVPSGEESAVQCSFNINGQLFQGNSKEECDKLKQDLNIDPTGNLPGGNPPQGGNNDGGAVVQCSFNINGKQYQGNSQEECDKLKKDLGFDDSFPF